MRTVSDSVVCLWGKNIQMQTTPPIEIDAALFAMESHHGQKRKYTGEGYIVHPRAVSLIVKTVPYTPEMLCAAWLHDVVEDCNVSIETIKEKFGDKVASLVSDLTDVSKLTDGNRRIRKQIDLEHTANASPEAKTIKLADIIDNTDSITKHDPDFSRIYLREVYKTILVCKEGDFNLYERALSLITEKCKEMNIGL